jgi:alpha-L-fucosidase
MGRGWSWRGGGGLMSPAGCIRMLVQCVGSGGNLALDCGPRPDGMIDPPEKENYLAMGRWLKKNGDSIYGTTGGPYKPGPYGVCTRKGNRIFLHILANFPESSRAVLQLPKLNADISKAYTLDGQPLTVNADYRKSGIFIDLSKTKLDAVDAIIVLELKSPADTISPIDPAAGIAIAKASASSSYGDDMTPDALISGGEGKFEAGIHRSRVWVAKGSPVREQWLQIELEKPQAVNALTIAEPRGRLLTEDFIIEYESDGSWHELYHGSKIGSSFSLLFKPITTAKLRLRILSYKQGDPGIQSFNIFSAE